MFNFFKKKKSESVGAQPSRFTFYPVGFHGDQYLLKVVDVLGKRSGLFIETGSNVGSTLSYFSKRFPKVKCLACEPEPEAFAHASKNAGGSNVTLYNETSQDFLKRLESIKHELATVPASFWLDAHGYGFQWPLIEEMVFLMSNTKSYMILIDDFEVPGKPEFGYDVYEGQYCTHDYIKDHLPKQTYYLYYPTYSEKTSAHHPLRGWGLYCSERINWADHNINFVREEIINP